MVIEKAFDNKHEKHIFLSQVAEEIDRYGQTDKRCPVCGGAFLLSNRGNSYVLRCETDDCLKMTSRGI